MLTTHLSPRHTPWEPWDELEVGGAYSPWLLSPLLAHPALPCGAPVRSVLWKTVNGRPCMEGYTVAEMDSERLLGRRGMWEMSHCLAYACD